MIIGNTPQDLSYTEVLVRLQIAPMEVGRINIEYRRVECTPPEPLMVSINFNYGPGAWLRIVVSVSNPIFGSVWSHLQHVPAKPPLPSLRGHVLRCSLHARHPIGTACTTQQRLIVRS